MLQRLCAGCMEGMLRAMGGSTAWECTLACETCVEVEVYYRTRVIAEVDGAFEEGVGGYVDSGRQGISVLYTTRESWEMSEDGPSLLPLCFCSAALVGGYSDVTLPYLMAWHFLVQHIFGVLRKFWSLCPMLLTSHQHWISSRAVLCLHACLRWCGAWRVWP
eukprot:scaffold119402_cov21-Tisochrysis_lutea.AAC.3